MGFRQSSLLCRSGANASAAKEDVKAEEVMTEAGQTEVSHTNVEAVILMCCLVQYFCFISSLLGKAEMVHHTKLLKLRVLLLWCIELHAYRAVPSA